MVQSTTLISGRKESQRLAALSLRTGSAVFIKVKSSFFSEFLIVAPNAEA
jgi:hypothetical protein